MLSEGLALGDWLRFCSLPTRHPRGHLGNAECLFCVYPAYRLRPTVTRCLLFFIVYVCADAFSPLLEITIYSLKWPLCPFPRVWFSFWCLVLSPALCRASLACKQLYFTVLSGSFVVRTAPPLPYYPQLSAKLAPLHGRGRKRLRGEFSCVLNRVWVDMSKK